MTGRVPRRRGDGGGAGLGASNAAEEGGWQNGRCWEAKGIGDQPAGRFTSGASFPAYREPSVARRTEDTLKKVRRTSPRGTAYFTSRYAVPRPVARRAKKWQGR